MELQVLVATMDRTDDSLVETMQFQRPAIIANQCGHWRNREYEHEFGTVQLLCSDTKGVGINRNLALLTATADILLFADDDITYYDPTLQGVVDAFRELPQADVIFFGMDMTRGGEITEKRHCKTQRRHLFNSMRYGTYRIAIRREAVQRHRLRFSHLFGGGCLYGSGEDTLFIADCFRAGLTVYSHSYVLGQCAKDSSSWFTGYNGKFFYDKGAWIAATFPKSKHLVKWYFGYRLSKKAGISLQQAMAEMDRGIRGWQDLTPYQEEVK